MKHILQHFKTLTKHPKNAEELKHLVKRLALEGKLTSDWRTENFKFSGEIELEELKGKSTNRLSKRDINELQSILGSFTKQDFPNSWGLCNLSEIADFWNGKAHESCVEENGDFVLVNSRFVSTNGSKIKKVTSCLSPLKKGEIAIVMSDVPDGRALSRCYIVEEDNKYTLNQRIGGITPVEGVSSTFLAFVLDRNPHYLAINDGKKQTNLKRIHMISCPIPFPPLEEQKAIVAIVNELFKEIEQLEDLTKSRIHLKESFVSSALLRLSQTENLNQEWLFLQTHFTEFFTEKENLTQLRETILQLAVEGKLTSKWRSFHPELVSGPYHASELLKRIQTEKQQLIAQKKIKKEKTLPPIEDHEKPYDLPEGWVWCNLGELVVLISGRDLTTKDYSDKELKYPYLTGASQIQDGKIILSRWTDNPKVLSILGDILISVKGTIGKIIINNVGEIHIARQIMALRGYDWIENQFINLFAKSYVTQLKEDSNGIIPGISREHLLFAKFPLPPLEEQKAIVKQVYSLMALCDSLGEHIENSQTQIEQLMQSCLREV